MSGIKCKCGNYFSTEAFPNSNGAWIVNEEEADDIDIDMSIDTINTIQYLSLLANSEKLYKCPYCKRIVISNPKDGIDGWDFYKLDENQ